MLALCDLDDLFDKASTQFALKIRNPVNVSILVYNWKETKLTLQWCIEAQYQT
jgi:hypothetical protein